jgi:hypothetical protein
LESILEANMQFLASLSVFLAMGVLCLAFSAYFYLKRRAVQKLPKNLSVNVFNKTFNVFDLSSKRRTIHNFGFILMLSPLTAFIWVFLFVFIVILNVLRSGLILGLFILILSMGFMMIDEALEVRESSNTFMKAVKARKGLGAGDLAIMSLVNDASRRLIIYYLLLGGIFFAAFFAMPYVFPVIFTIFTYLAGLLVGVTYSVQIFAPILTVFLFALFTVAAFIVAKNVKARILGFSSSDSLLSALGASARAQITIEKMQAMERKPEELTW